ncbi:hypothetical protein U5B43_07425 [Campylobacter sp. 9BO]|uniref:hypothetical protein n=1 Tax=Campylobacter sp. 9BO TaxID=3424759 RepID=UPI003D354651
MTTFLTFIVIVIVMGFFTIKHETMIEKALDLQSGERIENRYDFDIWKSIKNKLYIAFLIIIIPPGAMSQFNQNFAEDFLLVSIVISIIISAIMFYKSFGNVLIITNNRVVMIKNFKATSFYLNEVTEVNIEKEDGDAKIKIVDLQGQSNSIGCLKSDVEVIKNYILLKQLELRQLRS